MIFGNKWCLAALVAGCTLLSACGEKQTAVEPAKAAPAVKQEHLFSTQQRALEKAKAVEQQIQEAAKKQQAEINKQIQ